MKLWDLFIRFLAVWGEDSRVLWLSVPMEPKAVAAEVEGYGGGSGEGRGR